MSIAERLRNRWNYGKDMWIEMQSVVSFCNNEQNKLNGNWNNSELYEYLKAVHRLTHMTCIAEGINGGVKRRRVGKEYDGGYIMFHPFSEEKIAYSFGINNDISWEKDMAENGYDIYMYDHTIRALPEYNKRFHWSKKGITGGKEDKILKHLDSFIKQNGHEEIGGMVLKIDVEGSEWSVFNNCDEKVLLQFDQIVIELHGILQNENKQEILEVLEKINRTHSVVHIHANNYGRVNYCNELITPNTLEVTLVNKNKFRTIECDLMLPVMEDMPCNRRMADIFLGNW